MKTLRTIMTRRSTQRFASADAPNEGLTTSLLRAAMSAPSEGKAKPWHFIVIRNAKMIRNLAILLKAAETLHSAAMAIVVCADSLEQDQIGHWAIDCSAATENLVLAAHAEGLGSSWCRVFPSKGNMKTIGDLLKTPHHVTPFSAVFLGKPASTLNQRAASLVKKQIHLEEW